jgi:homopolymeric O-antigen transport system permease protein
MMYRVAKRTTGAADILASFNSASLVLLLAMEDVRQRYRRSVLGPFWITITQAILIAALAFVFGTVMGASISRLLPSLAIGLILWTFISTSVQDGCTSFISAEQILRQLPIPLFVQIQRVVIRNAVILLHNAVLVPIILVFSGTDFSLTNIACIPGFALLVANLLWSALLVAIICTRFRDMPQIIANMLQVAFYLSPIIWLPELLPSEQRWLLNVNPFYHLLEIVRAPLLGRLPPTESWIFSAAMAILGWLVAMLFFSRYRDRIPYWL